MGRPTGRSWLPGSGQIGQSWLPGSGQTGQSWLPGSGPRDFGGPPGATVRPLSVANSTSVSDNLLGPWLGLIGNSLNGSLNNSLNNSLNGAQVVADVGVLSPPFTVLSVTNIYNDPTVTQSQTMTITTNGGATGN